MDLPDNIMPDSDHEKEILKAVCSMIFMKDKMNFLIEDILNFFYLVL